MRRHAQAEVAAEGNGGWHLAWLRATNEATGASSVLPVERWVVPRPPPPHARSPPPGAAGEPGYRVAFLTARGCFAGTRAQACHPRPGPVAVLLEAIEIRGHRLCGPEALHSWSARCLCAAPRLQARRIARRAKAGDPRHAVQACGAMCTWAGATCRERGAVCSREAPVQAQVFFELIGERGRSGAVVLAAAAPAAFRPGGADAFTFPLLAPRGDLTWLRVGTDGAGLLPGWHLRRAPARPPARRARAAQCARPRGRPPRRGGRSHASAQISASLERMRSRICIAVSGRAGGARAPLDAARVQGHTPPGCPLLLTASASHARRTRLPGSNRRRRRATGAWR